jgi:hypothetical protein
MSSTTADRLRRFVGSRFLDGLTRGRRGRAFLYAFLIGAEEADERGVFDRLLARVDDPELHQLVRTHRDDELRHAAMLREHVERAGLDTIAIPAELQVVPFIDRALDRVADRFVADEAGVMEAYLLLQVLEERAVAQYPLFARALCAVDPAGAAVVLAIVRDEERHVKYARAISRRYAPDAAALEHTLARYRTAEARAFAEHGRALTRHVVDRAFLDVRGPERLAWRLLG